MLRRKNEIIFNLRLFWWKMYMVMSVHIVMFVIWFKDFYFISLSLMKRSRFNLHKFIYILFTSASDKSTNYDVESLKNSNVHVLSTPQRIIEEVMLLEIFLNFQGNHLQWTAMLHSAVDIFERVFRNLSQFFYGNPTKSYF